MLAGMAARTGVPPRLPPLMTPAEAEEVRGHLEAMQYPPPSCGVATCLVCLAAETPEVLVPALQDAINELTMCNAGVEDDFAAPSPLKPKGGGEEEEAEKRGEAPGARRVKPRGPASDTIVEAGARAMALLSLGSPTCVRWALFSLTAQRRSAFRKLVVAGSCRAGPGAQSHFIQMFSLFVEDVVHDANALSITKDSGATIIASACEDIVAMHRPRAARAGCEECADGARCAACEADEARRASGALAYRSGSLGHREKGTDGTVGAPWPIHPDDAVATLNVPARELAGYSRAEKRAFATPGGHGATQFA